MRKKLANYYKASFPCIVIETAEEARAVGDAYAAAKETGKAILTWSITEGLKMTAPQLSEYQDTQEPTAAFQQQVENAVYIFRDFSGLPFDRDPMLMRSFRDLLSWAPTAGSCVVVITPSFSPYPSIEKSCTVLDYPLPDPETLLVIAQNIAKTAGLELDGGTEPILAAMAGLSTTEAENAAALSVIETGKLDPLVISREKVLQVRKSKLLDLVEPDPRGLEAIGGMGNLKRFIIERTDTETRAAREYGLPMSKGILAVGPPGTGKSLLAKCVGTAMRRKMLCLNMGSMFGSLVGESEQRMREALKLADALAPVILWIDEIDKGLAGSTGSGAGDSGTTKRVYGQLITWMQERTKPVFIVATANDVSQLDGAVLRAGRFDKVFSVDLPTAEERNEIFRIHLRKRGRGELADSIGKDREKLDLNSASALFTGAEIEAVIEAAMFRAFYDKGREFTEADLVAAARKTVPIAKTAGEQVKFIREWAKTRAEPASETKATNDATRKLQT